MHTQSEPRRGLGPGPATRRMARAMALAAVLLAALTLPALARSRPARLEPTAPDRTASGRMPSAAARAQAGPARAPITVTVGGLMLQWRTLPNTTVTAELRAGEIVKARGQGQSDADGRLDLRLDGQREDASIQPGDTLHFKAETADDRWTVRVPLLAADVDAAANTVVGIAAPGTAVTLTVRLRPDAAVDYFSLFVDSPNDLWAPVPPALERRLTAAPDGSLRVDLTGDADIQPGDHVALSTTDAAGDRFVALAAATQVLVRADEAWALAYATLGTTVTLEVSQPDGAPRVVLQGVARQFDPSSMLAMAYLGPLDADEENPPVPHAGDRLVLRRTGGLRIQSPTTVTLPALAVDALDRGAVRARGPSGATLSGRLHGPFGERLDVALACDPNGRCDTPVAATLGAGWRTVLVWADAGGVASGVVGVVPQVRARVGASRVDGVAWPGHTVTATLRTPSGAPIGTYTDTAGDSGRFGVALVKRAADGSPAGEPHRMMPGTTIAVEFDGGDPVVVPIADLRTATDPDHETVSGAAPPLADVVVTLLRPAQTDPSGEGYDYRLAHRLDIKASPDGRWLADFGAVTDADGNGIDLEPPLWGEAVLVRPDGHFVLRAWAPIALDVALGSGWVTGHGPPGEDVAITLRGPDGKVVVERRTDNGSSPWGGDSPQWFADIADRFGKEVATAPGDSVEVTMGGESARFVLPPIEAASHIADDRVTGHTAPDAPIDLEIWTPQGDSDRVAGRSDIDGAFAFDLAARHVDLVYNAGVNLTVHVGRHAAWSNVDVPGMAVDLDSGTVSGSAEPDLDVSLALERAGRTVVQRRVFTDRYGSFDATFSAADGTAVLPHAGDVIVLSAPRARFIEPRVTMTVPDLTLELPTERDHVHGTFQTDGALDVELWSFGPSRNGPDMTDLQSGADGRWRLTWSNPDYRLSGGWLAHAQLTLPSGHQAYRNRFVPRLDLRIGGAEACGQALPGGRVAVDVRGTAGPGSAAAPGANGGRFSARFAAPDGRDRALEAGDRVTGDLGGWPVALTVPPLDLTVDWVHARITGTTAPSATLFVTGWQGGCRADPDSGLGGWADWLGAADANGRFGAEIPEDLLAFGIDGRFAVVVQTDDGHRIYRPLSTVRVTAGPDTPEAHGTGMPGSTFTATLSAPDGSVRSAAAGTVDGDGRWSVRFTAGGEPVRMRDGDRLAVGAGGDRASLVIETLAFDFDTRRGLIGSARPHRDVWVTLGLDRHGRSGDDEEWYDLRADADGRFAVDAPPPRARWSFADVRSVRATISLTDGHALESRLDLAPPPPPAVFLPVGYRGIGR